ncbi:MAG: hypothetical protein ACYC56_10080 [Candidatus Aquicultor sp.]
MSYIDHFRKIKNVNKVLKTVRGEVEQEVKIAVLAEPEVEAEILSILQLTEGNNVVFGLSEVRDEASRKAKLKAADLALVVVSPGTLKDGVDSIAKQASRAKKKLIVITGREINEWLVDNLADVFRVSGEDVAFVPLSDVQKIRTTLIPRIVSKIGDKEVALGAAVPIFKDEVVSRIIAKTAQQNALIGVAVFIPGADMPLLTMNQIKMILRLSAVYNQELSVKRLYEVLAVVGGGFAFREAARQVAGTVPVVGWALKGGVAYGGTIAMGQLAKRYFESWKGDIVNSGTTNSETTNGDRAETQKSLGTHRAGTSTGGEAEPVHKS